jgi:hypothetical protein
MSACGGKAHHDCLRAARKSPVAQTAEVDIRGLIHGVESCCIEKTICLGRE